MNTETKNTHSSKQQGNNYSRKNYTNPILSKTVHTNDAKQGYMERQTRQKYIC